MVKKVFSKRRLRIGAVFTGVGMIFVLLFLVFFKDGGVSKGVERTRKLSLKNQNVIDLKELSKGIKEPTRKKKLSNTKDKGQYIINENEDSLNDQTNTNKKNKDNKNKEGKKTIGNGHKKKPPKKMVNKNKMLKNKAKEGKKPGSTVTEMRLDNFSTKDFFKLYHFGENYRDKDDPKGINCPVPWTWTDDEEDSDIIVMNVLDNLGEIMRIENYNYDKTRQKLLLMSMESTSNYNVMLYKKQFFNYFIDYRLDSDVPIPYTYSFFDFTKPPLPTKSKGLGGRGLAAAFISNCGARNKRLEYLRELMKYTKIDSFGMCAYNREVFPEDESDNSWSTKMNTIRKYKFTLAFENSDDRDYVTEKFFQPLEVGSVPVFYGTSNIADFAPPHSYIDARDFASAKELAEYLEFLDKNDREYEEYLAWKKTSLGDNLNHLIEIRKLNSICQLLQRIKGLWINPYLTIWDRDDIPKNERACGLC
ncbi:glycosyltransferase family 10 protein [Piromyces sp. E2]|nr:glycosyltransferase family 10 protein [Piromyces sp. E2]|eukprot:OUM59971.1 glycosyltransferase family 10 protein [Piromyces sp. E2]